MLKKNYNKKERIEKVKDNYYKELDRLEINVKDDSFPHFQRIISTIAIFTKWNNVINPNF